MSDFNPTPRRAVLCGISNYGAEFGSIPAIAIDRQRLAHRLKNELAEEFRFDRVDVHKDENLYLTELEVIFDSLSRDSALSEGDLFIYLAGHGCERRGKPYFVTYGSKLEAPGIRIDDLNEMLLGVRAQRTFAVLDFCHAGAIPLALPPLQSFGLRDGPSLAILTACRYSEVSTAGTFDEPSFTSHFIDGLMQARADENGGISWNHISTFLHRRMARSVLSRPIDACTSMTLRHRVLNRVVVPIAITTATHTAASTSTLIGSERSTLTAEEREPVGPIFLVTGDGGSAAGFACVDTGLVVTTNAVGQVSSVTDAETGQTFEAQSIWIGNSLLQIASAGVNTIPLSALPNIEPELGSRVRIQGPGTDYTGTIDLIEVSYRVNVNGLMISLENQFSVRLDAADAEISKGSPVLRLDGLVLGVVVASDSTNSVYVEPWAGVHAAFAGRADKQGDINGWENQFSRGVTYANLRGGRDTDIVALRAYNEAIALAPTDADVDMRARMFSYRGAIHKRLNRLQEAEGDLRIAQGLATREYEIGDVLYNLACVYAMRQDRDALMQVLAKIGPRPQVWRSIQAHSEDYFASFWSDSELQQFVALHLGATAVRR